jgi:ribonuclease P protein component
MTVDKNTFTKEERLCSKKLLSALFLNRSSFLVYPYKVNWYFNSQDLINNSSKVQVVFSVSKKRFKRSVDRNLIKRRIKEVYRLQKQELLYAHLTHPNQQLILGLTYVGKEILVSDFLDKKLKLVFSQLFTQINSKANEVH